MTTDARTIVDFSSASKALGQAPKPIRIYLLGQMRVIGPGGEGLLPRFRKTRALLAYLCLAAGAPVLRRRLIGLLWDRVGEAQARNSLRNALFELNALNRIVPNLLTIERELVRLDPKACWIDALADPDRAEPLVEDLEGISPAFDHWLMGERSRFEDQTKARLEEELDRLVRLDAEPQLRLSAARRLINFLPTHEGAVRALMTAFTQLGDRPQAIREYERCRSALQTMLDVKPSRETVALYEALRIAAVNGPEATGEKTPILDSPNGGPAVLAGQRRDSRLSIGVLPVRNLSNEREHDNLAAGLVIDLIDTLSRVPNFFVVSRLSTLAFAAQDRLPQEIGEALGVRYLLSGGLRATGDRMRLSAELTDACSGTVLWSGRFDEHLTNLLDVQERLAWEIVRRVAPHLQTAELKRVRAKRPEHLEAYDLFLRAQESMYNSSRAIFDGAEALFDRALACDPTYAAALAWRAYFHVLRVGQGWSPDPEQDTWQAERFAQRAVDCDALEPMGFAVQGHVASYLRKDFPTAFNCFGTALRLNPNAAPAWLWSAAAHAWTGDGPSAIEQIDKAMSLSPYDPLMYAYSMIAAIAYLVDDQPERAVECARRSIRENATYTSAHRLLVMALMLADRKSEARSAAFQLLKLEPDLTVERFWRRYPGSGSAHAERFCAALGEAGIPLTD